MYFLILIVSKFDQWAWLHNAVGVGYICGLMSDDFAFVCWQFLSIQDLTAIAWLMAMRPGFKVIQFLDLYIYVVVVVVVFIQSCGHKTK